MDYSKHTVNRVETPQTDKVPGVKGQKSNNAGGVAFALSKWGCLDRFLILGTEGGTYYVSERKLTKDNVKNLEACIAEDGIRTVDTIVNVSQEGRSAQNDAAIFALALCAADKNPAVRKHALDNLERVCRIGTHLFNFMRYVKTMRGTGRGLRKAISRWYLGKSNDTLAYQLMKYQQRDGWSHKNVLQIAHPKPLNKDQDKLFAYVVGKRDKLPKVTDLCIGIRKVRKAENAKDIASAVLQYSLPREVVPTEFLNDVGVWEAMLQSMPITACIRNLGKMSSLGMLGAQSNATKTVVRYLTDENRIKNGRVHPLNIMNALITYKAGHGAKGGLSWSPIAKISAALEDAFYASFKYVEPSGKRIMCALDVSGSMTSYKLSNSQMDCRTGSAVMAMVTMRTEPEHMITGFTGDGRNATDFGGKGSHYGFRSYVSELDISPRQMLGDVVRYVKGLDFGATDCAAPMSFAIKNNLDIDTFVVYTDNETRAGRVHPFQELEKYRQKSGIPAKLIVVGMVTNDVTIANPNDPGMLDVVGFDTNTPNAISEFARI